MLRAVPMVHLRVQVPSRDGAAVTREIAAKGLLHLIDIAHGASQAASAAPSPALLARYRDLAQTIRRLVDTLGLTLPNLTGPLAVPQPSGDFAVEFEQIAAALEPVRAEVEPAVRRRTQAREERSRLADLVERAEWLRGVAVEPAR